MQERLSFYNCFEEELRFKTLQTMGFEYFSYLQEIKTQFYDNLNCLV